MVMSMDQPPLNPPLAPGVDLPDAALTFTFSRGGGPGGQNVNKLNTHATLTVPLDALHDAMPPAAYRRLLNHAGRYLATDRLVIHASDSRSQLANRKSCLEKLRSLLVKAMHRPKVRHKTRPSRRSIERQNEAKRRRSKLKARRAADRRPPRDT